MRGEGGAPVRADRGIGALPCGQGQGGGNQASQALNAITTIGKLLGTVGAVGVAGAMMRKGRK